jgi:hypothetical protein
MTKEQNKIEAWEEARERARRAVVEIVDEVYDAMRRLVDINNSLEKRLDDAERERNGVRRERDMLWKERLLKSSEHLKQ